MIDFSTLNRLGPVSDTALHSLDFGEVLSPDGRAHPLDALTPITVYTAPAAGPTAPVSGTTGPGNASGTTLAGFGLPSLPSFPSHFGARFVVGVVGVGLVLIVAWRLAR